MESRFGDYVLLGKIGEGRMGEVWNARQESQDRHVTLRLIKPGYFTSVAEIQRFRLELENLKNLDHPNIITVHDAGEFSGQYFFAMEPANGGSLAEQIAAGRWRIEAGNSRENQRAIARLMATIADAIHHAHLRGVLHRNLKPSNILMDEKDAPHLTDFGLTRSRPRTQGALETEPGSPAQPVSYQAPEQVGDYAHQWTAATDLYGLGAIFYKLLTGRPPFAADSVVRLERKAIHDEPRKPRADNPLIEKELEIICLKCLEKDPSNRPHSAGDVATQLKHWLAERPIEWSRSGRVKEAKRVGRGFARAAVVVAMAAVVITVFMVASGWQWQEEPTTAKAAFVDAFKRDNHGRDGKQTVGVSARAGDLRVSTPVLDLAPAVPSTATSSLASEEKFREAVRTILDNPPTNSATLATFGQALSSDLPWMAEALVSESVRLDPTNVQLLQQQAAIFKEHGKSTRALEAIETALQMPSNSRNHQLWRLKGVTLDELGQTEKSLEAFSTALDIVKTNTAIPDTVRAEYVKNRTRLQEQLAREAPRETILTLSDSSGESATPTPTPSRKLAPAALDLSPYYTSTLESGSEEGRVAPTANNLAGLSSRLIRVEEIEFKVSGILQLANGQMSNDSSAFPKAVEQIRVGRTFTRLHLLHGTVWPAPTGTAVARLVIRYADGDYAEIPIVYGVDVQELIYDPALGQYAAGAKPAWIAEERGLLALTAGKSRRAVWKPGSVPEKDWKLIWYGSAGNIHSLWSDMQVGKSTMRRWGSRLYRLKWTNPRPDGEVASMDFVSTMTPSAPFLLAAATE